MLAPNMRRSGERIPKLEEGGRPRSRRRGEERNVFSVLLAKGGPIGNLLAVLKHQFYRTLLAFNRRPIPPLAWHESDPLGPGSPGWTPSPMPSSSVPCVPSDPPSNMLHAAAFVDCCRRHRVLCSKRRAVRSISSASSEASPYRSLRKSHQATARDNQWFAGVTNGFESVARFR